MIVRLTETAWRARELKRVRAALGYHLDREGIEQGKLAGLLKKYLAREYTAEELVWFRDQLVAEGVIEVV